MKTVLVQLDTDPQPSVFDAVVAVDAGVDCLLQYSNVGVNNVQDLVYGAMFTRGGKDLNNTALFIGGSGVEAAEEVLSRVNETFFGPVRVSVLMDANGCNTTAAAAVHRIRGVAELDGRRAVVLAGTGPVGMRAAALMALEGARVTLTSRNPDRGKRVAGHIRERYNVDVDAVAVDPSADQAAVQEVLSRAEIVLAAGPPGARLAEEATWSGVRTLQVVADINAVPPGGLVGVEAQDNGEERHGKVCFGALGVGGFKMRLHKECIKQLFAQNDLVLDAQQVFQLGDKL